jgi:hypothetical protein
MFNNKLQMYKKELYLQNKKADLPTRYMQYGGFSAKIKFSTQWIYSDYRIFIAQSRHIAYTRPLLKKNINKFQK